MRYGQHGQSCFSAAVQPKSQAITLSSSRAASFVYSRCQRSSDLIRLIWEISWKRVEAQLSIHALFLPEIKAQLVLALKTLIKNESADGAVSSEELFEHSFAYLHIHSNLQFDTVTLCELISTGD